MANRIVIGVLGSCEPAQVERAIAASGIDRTQLRVLTAEDPTQEHEDSPISFVHLGEFAPESLDEEMMRGTGVLSDFGGMSVPGINTQESGFSVFDHPEVADYLKGINIPSGDEEYYNEAIDDGRCVVVCTCDGTACDATVQALEKAGLANVRTF